jgi:hypothetical protein
MIELLVGILATWRIAAWLYLDGDAKWLHKARDRFEFLSCPWCVTTWVGFLLTPFVIWYHWPLIPFALSGAAMLLSQGGRIIWRDMVDG